MLEDHRTGPRYDTLLSTYPEDDRNSGWMISYIDIMTLLVALFVVIIATAEVTAPSWLAQQAESPNDERPLSAVVPLPAELESFQQRREVPVDRLLPDELSSMAISAALGVAGLPPRRSAKQVPELLALAVETPTAPPPHASIVLPRLLLPAYESDWASPLADYMVLLTDRPPVNVEEVSEDVAGRVLLGDERLPERVETSTYLPNLEGVEVSRVAEGISLRVQDQLLFPSATAELTAGGSSLVASLLETIQRYDGEVWVEGHSDSQSINTPEYSSNWALSSARAIAIVEALEAAGVDAERLRAVGLAATQPLEDNHTPEGRARNRRVEVVIHVE